MRSSRRGRQSLLRLASMLGGAWLFLSSFAAGEPPPIAQLGEAQLGDTQTLPDPETYFEREVRPVLVTNCVECHGPEVQESGVRVDSRESLLADDGGGPLIVPGDPDGSRLVLAIRQTGEIPMPPETRLPEQAIAAIEKWVAAGAFWPEGAVVASPDVAAASHWAFQPLRRGPFAGAKPEEPSLSAIDRQVESGLVAAGLKSNPPADRQTLIRRLHFDLIGLPPTPEEVDAFVADSSSAAIPSLVDRLLSSPHFGERWGRYWLDLARYADTKGYVFEEDRHYKYAYLYRDWVIDAFNEDLPYDRFLLFQIAADHLIEEGDKAPLAAMGFLTLGRRFLNNPHDIIDDRIDVITRTTLGLTVSCARCHDHKYDPIPTQDYYSLYGVLAASREELLALAEPGAEYLAELQRRQEAARAYAAGEAKQGRLNELNRQIQEWMNSETAPPQIGVLVDPVDPQPLPRVFQRGNPGTPGEEVPRRFLRVLSGDDRVAFASASGRWEFAQAIASDRNPLTARVWANRVWGHLIGRPLVGTPSDFGLRGDPPTHPELLDYLAQRLVDGNWSTKSLIREIVLSATYQRSSRNDPQAAASDPENRHLWRAHRRRMDWESLHDGLLHVAGRLDRTMHGPSVDITKPPYPTRRAIYAFIDRQNLPGVFRTFDFASPDSHGPLRFTTTVPQQALFLMNHPFVREQAAALVRRSDLASLSDDERIGRLYRILFARSPNDHELAWGLDYRNAQRGLPRDPTEPAEVESTTPTEPEQATDGIDAWTDYAHALLMSNEFLFID